MIHFAIKGTYEAPTACGTRIVEGVSVTNKWARVNCEECIAARYHVDRPDLVFRHKAQIRETDKVLREVMARAATEED